MTAGSWGFWGAVVAGGVAFGLLARLLHYLWDTYRSRGTIQNPLTGGTGVRVPTTAALRAARRGTTEAPPWLDVRWTLAPMTWPEPVEEGQIVELHARDAADRVLVARLRVRSRAFRMSDGRQWVDYLGESLASGELGDPFRASFSDAMIWGVEEGA